MSQEQWSAVDTYISDLMMPPDAVLDATLQLSTDSGLPAIQVAPNQGKLLMIIALAMNAHRILEIGTLGGYSTIWLARGLSAGGKLITLEYEPKHAEVARTNIERAGLSDRVEVRVGRALDTLPVLATENQGAFDLIFIDADKPAYPEYFDWALKLSRPGTLIVADNVIRQGAIVDGASEDQNVQGMRLFHERVGAESRVSATAIQTVGCKGYDGLSFAVVLPAP